MTPIALANISKNYGRKGLPILEDLCLDIAAGELFFLLGPSGCGKSTLLRIVAGLLTPSAGTIHFGAEEVTRLPTERRQTALVFQNYALWPHLSVLENVAFGLTLRHLPKAQVEAQARAALTMVDLAQYADRRPAALSGGEQQRVALARAMAVKPRVLLLDEPLSNLDAKLRLAMRHEIRRLCKESGLTTIYVTHDQKEALSMADRMAVLQGGRLRQVGSPRELYRRPANKFVADFIGEGNFIPATVVGQERDHYLTTSALGPMTGVPGSGANFAPGARVTLLIRPECLRPTPAEKTDAPRPNTFAATISGAVFLGEIGQWTVMVGQLPLLVVEQDPPGRQPGDHLLLHADPENVVLLPSEPA